VLDTAAHARMTSRPIVNLIVQRDGFGSVPLAAWPPGSCAG
jgi:hypothetical protein